MTPIQRLLLSFILVIGVVSGAACQPRLTNEKPYGAALSESSGKFAEVKVVDASQTPLHASCGSDAGVIDSRLKPGMAFESIRKVINGTKVNKILALRSRILSVDPKRLEERVMPVLASGIQGVTIGNEEPMVCSYDAQGKGSCQTPDFIASADPAMAGEYTQCALTGSGSDIPKQRSSVGKFTLQGGQVIDVYMIVTSFKGALECNNGPQGEGERLEVLVLSNDVPAEGTPSACGGTKIFSSLAYKNTYGRVLWGSSFERTAIP